MPLVLKVKLLNKYAVLPKKAHHNDAGFDIVATSDGLVSDTFVEYHTGIALEIPKGYHVELWPRGSVTKTSLMLGNSLGLIDQGYNGEVICRFKIIPEFLENEQGFLERVEPLVYRQGEKIGQLVLQKDEDVVIEEAKELHKTERADGKFGSSDKA